MSDETSVTAGEPSCAPSAAVLGLTLSMSDETSVTAGEPSCALSATTLGITLSINDETFVTAGEPSCALSAAALGLTLSMSDETFVAAEGDTLDFVLEPLLYLRKYSLFNALQSSVESFSTFSLLTVLIGIISPLSMSITRFAVLRFPSSSQSVPFFVVFL